MQVVITLEVQHSYLMEVSLHTLNFLYRVMTSGRQIASVASSN